MITTKAATMIALQQHQPMRRKKNEPYRIVPIQNTHPPHLEHLKRKLAEAGELLDEYTLHLRTEARRAHLEMERASKRMADEDAAWRRRHPKP
jgi:hypothetical protein